MQQNRLKIIFWIIAAMMLAALLLISRDAGISGDEEVHYLHSEMVYNYFSTGGQDQSSIHTPKTHLQYYGQMFDNLVTFMSHWFGIDDIYGFRHLMSSLSGWLTIVVTGLFAAYFAGYGAAIFVLLLFSVSPTFLGHSQNNLKDIPFALAYIGSVYYSLKLVYGNGKPSIQTIVLLILSIAFAIGIRAGGILVVFYLGLFMSLKTAMDWIKHKSLDWKQVNRFLVLFGIIALLGYLLGLVTWPFAMQNPLLNPWKSYQVMTSFPTTVRQIFEGRFEWSDYLPWYYLPKYMVITFPLVVFAGLGAFIFTTRKKFTEDQKIQVLLVLFTILFPIVFVLLKGSNLYGSWRHFLFVYPGIVLLAALGLHAFFIRFKQPLIRIAAIVLLLVLSFHPLKFMASNHPYYYLYYNQLVGGLKGAYGDYETDYYYHSMREGAEWLKQHLGTESPRSPVIVGGNFPVQWYFRNDPAMKFVYIPYQTRSNYNWDYAIIANSYIPPSQLKNKTWPPANTIHTVMVDGIPICAVIKRLSKEDMEGLRALKNGEYIKSAHLLQKAMELDPENEWIYYKFAEVLANQNRNEEAVQILEKSLEINPQFEQALMMLGTQALIRDEKDTAAAYFRQVIAANRKYLAAYIQLAAIYSETNVDLSRKVLKDCLEINSRYQPALRALAETYRKSAPEVARKYDELINTLK